MAEERSAPALPVESPGPGQEQNLPTLPALNAEIAVEEQIYSQFIGFVGSEPAAKTAQVNESVLDVIDEEDLSDSSVDSTDFKKLKRDLGYASDDEATSPPKQPAQQVFMADLAPVSEAQDTDMTDVDKAEDAEASGAAKEKDSEAAGAKAAKR